MSIWWLVLVLCFEGTAAGRSSSLRLPSRSALQLGSSPPRHELVAWLKPKAAQQADDSVAAVNETAANSSVASTAPRKGLGGIVRRFQNWLDTLHQAAITRFLVTACVYWMAYASWQMNRDMQLFTNPLRDVGKQTKEATKKLKMELERAKIKAAPATAEATRSSRQVRLLQAAPPPKRLPRRRPRPGRQPRPTRLRQSRL